MPNRLTQEVLKRRIIWRVLVGVFVTTLIVASLGSFPLFEQLLTARKDSLSERVRALSEICSSILTELSNRLGEFSGSLPSDSAQPAREWIKILADTPEVSGVVRFLRGTRVASEGVLVPSSFEAYANSSIRSPRIVGSHLYENRKYFVFASPILDKNSTFVGVDLVNVAASYLEEPLSEAAGLSDTNLMLLLLGNEGAQVGSELGADFDRFEKSALLSGFEEAIKKDKRYFEFIGVNSEVFSAAQMADSSQQIKLVLFLPQEKLFESAYRKLKIAIAIGVLLTAFCVFLLVRWVRLALGGVASAEELAEEKEKVSLVEHHFQAILHGCSAGVFSKGLDGKYTFANKQYLSYLELPLDSVEGKRDEEFLSPETARIFQKADETAIRSGVTVEVEHTLEDGGVSKTFIGSVFPLVDPNGKIYGTGGMAYDVTERARDQKLIEEQRNFLDAILENIPNMVFVKDAKELRFVRFNRAGEDLLGYPREALIGKNDYDFFPEKEAQFFIDKDRKVLSDNSVLEISEEPIHTKEKGIRYLHTRKVPVSVGRGTRPEYLLGISEDITELREVQSAARESEKRFRELCENLSSIVWIREAKSGKLIYINSSYDKIVGVSREKLIAGEADWFDFVHPEDRQVIKKLFEEEAAEGIFSQEYRLLLPNGSTVWVWDRCFPIKNEKGEIYRLAGITEDVTDWIRLQQEIVKANRELEQRELMLRTTLDSMPAIAWIQDSDHKTVYLNDYWYELTGIDRAADMQKSTLEAVHPGDIERIMGLADKAYRSGQKYSAECRIKVRDGSYRDTYFQVAPVEIGGKIVNWVGVNIDISEQKEMAKRLAKMNEELEERVEERTRELQESNRELEQFASIASHDLQEPLRKISSFTELLQEELDGTLNEISQKYMNVITEASQRMRSLIQDLLLYSRVSRNDLLKEPVDLKETMRHVTDDLGNAILDTKAVVVFEDLPTIEGNGTQLYQLLQNLVSNSPKYHGSAPPKVKLSAEKKGDEWLICCEDNGIGFDPKYSERVFQLFQRLHSRSEYPGTGIGLSLCKRIVERHGGKIWVETAPGKGTKFFFTLPSPVG